MAPVKKKPRVREKHFIKEWREFRGHSQDHVADLIEIDRSSLSKVEAGLVPYNQDLLEKLALVYLCDTEDMISIDPLKPDAPRLIYAKLRSASPEKQRQALSILEAFLKAS